MTRRSPTQYNWSKCEFDDRILPSKPARMTAPRRGKIKHIDIHHMTIVGDGSGKAIQGCINTWKTREASAHYGVEENLVAQFVWDSNAAWGNANSTANHEGIVVEHANTTREPSWKVSDKTLKTSARLVANLHVLYKLGRPTSKGFGEGGTIRTHQSFYATSCPGPYFKSIWSKYVADVQREYDAIVDAKPAAPKPDIEPWFNAAFLNIAGNNKTLAVSTAKRSSTFTDDITAGSPAVIGFAEVRSDQIDALTKTMAGHGYKKAAHSHMLAVFVRGHVVVRGSSFAKYKKQGKGSVEGMLRVKLTIDGSKCQVGVTHLDYPADSTSLRVAQFKDGIAALKRFGIVTLLPDWKSRTIILADINDSTGAVVKAAKDAGFKDVDAGASIDKIFVGAKRKMRGASKHKTTSDHPIIKAKVGRA